MDLRRVGTVHCNVGEGPVWDVAEQALYFVDLTSALLWRYSPASGAFVKWKMPSMIGSFALRATGGAVVALQDGFHALDFDTGAVYPLVNPQPDDRTQFNDGKVDPRGRFIAATQARSLKETTPLGRLYRLDPDLTVTELDSGFGITNGPCWSPDGRTFYFSNSLPKTILVYDYDPDTGSVSNRRVFASTEAFGGIPDGATVDRDGRLWVAVCGGGKIVCFRPDGTVDRVIDVPTPLVASVMFGGRTLDQLYFTSIDGAALDMPFPADPHSGGLFVIEGLGVTGRPEPRFGG